MTVDPAQERQKRLEAATSRARLGYFRIPVRPLPKGLSITEHNNRTLNDSNVKAIQQDMIDAGVRSSEEETCLKLGVHAGWIQNLADKADTLEGVLISELKTLDLSPEGLCAIKQGQSSLFGGNHRLHALHGACEQQETKLNTLLGKKARGKKRTAAARTLDDKIDKLKSWLAAASYWAVKVYDIGECYAMANQSSCVSEPH